jgi:hypothetical protein
MKRLLLVALAMAWLLAFASALPAAAYDGEARATMSCTDNTSTMTRTVVTVKWTGVGIDRMDAQAWGGSPTVLLGSGSTTFPLAKKGDRVDDVLL